MAKEEERKRQEVLNLLRMLRGETDHPELHHRIQEGDLSEAAEQPSEHSTHTDRRRGPRQGEQKTREPRRPNAPRPPQYTEATGTPIHEAISDALRQRPDDEGPAAAGGVREPRRPIKPTGNAGAAVKPPKR